MDDAQELEDRAEPEGSLAWAGVQTAGRGRHPGRVWQGAPGDSLTFTVYWSASRFRVPGFAASLTVGLGLCLWLEALGAAPGRVRLKWPNDVYLDDRKLSGILVRQRWSATGPGRIHAGIGVNLAAPASAGLRTPAASLAEAGLNLTPEQALSSLLPSLAQALGHPSPRQACEARLWRLGEEMELSTPSDDRPRRGVVRGLDEGGGLVWDTASGREVVSSGE
jgi:BirA family biotin operon repressor/biotin-[acetyl-CoA-carboxylase] ligase